MADVVHSTSSPLKTTLSGDIDVPEATLATSKRSSSAASPRLAARKPSRAPPELDIKEKDGDSPAPGGKPERSNSVGRVVNEKHKR